MEKNNEITDSEVGAKNLIQQIVQKYKYIFDGTDVKALSIEKILETVIAYYESIIDCMPGNVYWLDRNGITLGCNRNVLDMFGLSSIEDFKNLSFEDMQKLGNWSSNATKSFKEDTLTVVKTGVSRINVEEPPIPHANGSIIYFLTSRVPLFNNQHIVNGVVGISIDITERKKTEADLKEAKEQAEVANQAKTHFIRNMEHDIRTPFNGIWGVSNMLWEDEADPHKKEHLGDIARAAKELMDFCNDILDFTKTELNILPVIVKKFDLNELIDSVMAIQKPAASFKKLVLELEYDKTIPSILIGDQYRLQRILINLLSNSIKFTEKGFVKLKIKLIKKIEPKIVIIRFDVEDSGVGIPADKIQFIFEKFSRGTPANMGRYKGIGLGLTIVKQFMQELQGEIDIDSEPNQGSTFTCTLPFELPLSDNMVQAM